jgi:hypothetical protein
VKSHRRRGAGMIIGEVYAYHEQQLTNPVGSQKSSHELFLSVNHLECSEPGMMGRMIS